MEDYASVRLLLLVADGEYVLASRTQVAEKQFSAITAVNTPVFRLKFGFRSLLDRLWDVGNLALNYYHR